MTLEVLGALVGLLYLWFEYHASIWVWATGIVMPVIYLFVYYQAGLYADFAINIYYVAASVWGVWVWRKGRALAKEGAALAKEKEGTSPVPFSSRKELGVRLLDAKTGARLFVVALFLIIAIAQALIHFTNSTVPWADSFTTALSIVAMYMLARKYVEQWLVWMVVDAVCVALYVYKGLYATSLLYALYTIIAIAGYYKWKRMI